MILLYSVICRPGKRTIFWFSLRMILKTRSVIPNTKAHFVFLLLFIFFTKYSSNFRGFVCFILLTLFHLFFFSLVLKLYYTATKLRYFSDLKLGISVPARGESSDLLNADGEKNDYDWWALIFPFWFSFTSYWFIIDPRLLSNGSKPNRKQNVCMHT